MSTPSIGYVDLVREDLLEAAWRSSMASERLPRRRPSRRWIVAGATAVTLVAAGVVGWVVLGERTQPLIRAGNKMLIPSHRAEESATRNPGLTQDLSVSAGTVPGDVPLGSVAPVGDLSRVIKTAQVSIVVGHEAFGERFDGISEIADRLGGYVQTSSTRSGRSGSVTMRVPADRFQDALRSLRGLGRVESESVSGKDVTAQYVDLTARLRIALARRRVLFRLMDKAVSIGQTIRVQNALDDVQLRIEELQGAINVLSDRVADATIRVSMRETGVEPAGTNVENPSISGAFDRAVAGFFGVIAGVIVGLGYVLPAIALLALLWFAVTRIRRRFA